MTVPTPIAEPNPETLAALAAISWTSSLTPEERKLFASFGEIIAIRGKDVVIREGLVCQHLYFVLEGMLSVRQNSDGAETVVGVVGVGEPIGEMTMVSRRPATNSVVALEPCKLWRISHYDVMSFIYDNPQPGIEILLALLQHISQRLANVNSDLAAMLNSRHQH